MDNSSECNGYRESPNNTHMNGMKKASSKKDLSNFSILEMDNSSECNGYRESPNKTLMNGMKKASSKKDMSNLSILEMDNSSECNGDRESPNKTLMNGMKTASSIEHMNNFSILEKDNSSECNGYRESLKKTLMNGMKTASSIEHMNNFSILEKDNSSECNGYRESPNKSPMNGINEAPGKTEMHFRPLDMNNISTNGNEPHNYQESPNKTHISQHYGFQNGPNKTHINRMNKAPGKTEMSNFSTLDVDNSSTNSNEYDGYQESPTKTPINSLQYVDVDAESQNFLSGKKKYENEYTPGSASFGMSVFNLGNAIMGSGILGLSYAMANTGIALFVILLVAVLIFSLYSVHLLLKTANEGGSMVYEQLGYKAFGLPGKLAASCSITMQNFGAMASYLFIVKYELPIVIKSFLDTNDNSWYTNGDYLVLIVTVGIILPLSLLKNLGYLGYTSGFSLLCMVFFLIVVIYKKFQIPCPLPETLINITVNSSVSKPNTTEDDCCKPKYFVFNSQTVYAVPILTFAFVCHPAILPMYQELKDRSRQKMQNVANVSFLGMFVMYLLAALFGYLTFNEAVESELLHTYSRVYDFDLVLMIVRFAVLVAVTLTVPVVLFPIRTSVNHLTGATKNFSWPRHISITVGLLVCVNILVIFVPTIRDIFGFIGASAAAMLIFILPSAFYIQLVKKESMKSIQKISALLFLITGIFVMLGSITLIILDWIHNAGVSEDTGSGH
ncbi:sodium-coupled neutral amino acid symporter 2 isoform X2 [Misgurnus anguillicaudatus]|uniref:sodium-coupled neutral amino acid symporter 2 isoform X2 n=1 Tax=Misgurnus anguillicaudatus TaxID=75329 RepID=UPI003CCF35A1